MDESCQTAAPFAIRISVSEGILHQELDGEVVLLNVENELYYSLNSMGSRMWRLLTELGDVETVCRELLKTLPVDEVVLRRDLANLVDQLCQEGLLVVTRPSETDVKVVDSSLSSIAPGVVVDTAANVQS